MNPGPPTKLALAALLALVALLSFTNPTPASAARGMELAVQDDKIFVLNEAPGVDRGLDDARQLGVTTVRALVGWKRSPDLAPFDRLVAAADARGMRVQLSLTGMPRWGGGTKTTDTTKPSAKAFGKFAGRIAAHFRGKVKSYSVWNEPNWHSWLVPAKAAPKQYRALYQAGFAAIKKADRKAKVLLGELAPSVNPPLSVGPLRFMRAMTCISASGKRVKRCKPLRTDGVALHPYEFKHAPSWRGARAGSVTIGTLSRLTKELKLLSRKRALVSTSGGPAPIYITEFGYFASGKRSTPARKRAAWLPKAFQIALRNKRVKQMTLFGLVRDPGEKWDVGLVDAAGRRDAAFDSLQRWSKARASMVASSLGKLPAS